MPTRHGIHSSIPPGLPTGTPLTPEQWPSFRYGIWQVFDALRAGPFLAMDDRSKAAKLQQHFGEVSRRFLYSLQHLNGLMQRMAAGLASRSFPPEVPQIELEAGCQADHVLTYLNIMVDDVAQAIVLATGLKNDRIESMGQLKHDEIATLPALSAVRGLLKELNDPESWWGLAFKPRHGARQLLIHNHYVVSFHGAQSPGEPMEAKANLISAYQKHSIDGDFFNLLRAILASLCDWLDRLECALLGHLQTMSGAWTPMPHCPRIPLGLGFPLSGVTYHPLYFPLPLCDGSDPLPWTIGPPVLSGSSPAT
jgi:hypothetical protein